MTLAVVTVSSLPGSLPCAVALQPRCDFVAHDVERDEIGQHRLPDQQLERAFRSFEVIAFVLHRFEPLQQFTPRCLVQQFIPETQLLQLVRDVATPRQVAQQHTLAVADEPPD